MKPASTIIKASLQEKFTAAWERCRVLFFSAPCGCGKTTTVNALLGGHSVFALQADVAVSTESIARGHDTVLLDELSRLPGEAEQQALCALIRNKPNLHFVLLSRGRLPSWLMPFQLAGMLFTFTAEDLFFDLAATRRLLVAYGCTLPEREVAAIQQETQGYPVALSLLCHQLEGRAHYTPALIDAARRELFAYYDEMVYHRLGLDTRRLLLDLTPLKRFNVELATMVSGNSHAGELLADLLQNTNMLLFDGVQCYHFYDIFLAFLQWKVTFECTEEDLKTLFGRAALYYELQGELTEALHCYEQAGETHKISALLAQNAEQTPALGHYYELEKYYYALPHAEILRSPALMCGMSMLESLCLDFEASERWYTALKQYASQMNRTDAEYSAVQGKLLYLDIALPQRGVRGITDIIRLAFRAIMNKEAHIPSLSVTSRLPSIMNGGKDFCSWAKKDDRMYATMRLPVETLLGKDGVGLADCAICESKLEKGDDLLGHMMTLMSRLGEIQTAGTPDIEFVAVGLLARAQVLQGKPGPALESLESLRAKFVEQGHTRFLPNLDAMLCRIQLRVGNAETTERWYHEKAPRNELRVRGLWRYQYLTLALVQLTRGETEEALLGLARLLPYCHQCARIMDTIYIQLLMAIAHYQKNDPTWQTELCQALDACQRYALVTPVAQHGAVLLPLLRAVPWKGSPAFLAKLLQATQIQAVNYPNFLKPPAALSEPLSTTELQVLKLICHNLSNNEIGEILGIKLATVKTHVSHVLQKLSISRRSEAGAAAERLHLI
ncbi:MAG: LuxR C-terminal-related transcriptional regulator [Gemmiger sp.]|nr:LuxR C-terminal-related transcriptional regulator [Gemmiger sp.]